MAQSPAGSLPPGTYEIKAASGWNRGDILLVDEKHYRVGNSSETGEYKYSATAQRIFFLSGTLKGLYAKTETANGAPVIIFPASENKRLGYELPADLYGYFKKKN